MNLRRRLVDKLARGHQAEPMPLGNHPMLDPRMLAEARRVVRKLARQQRRTPKWDPKRTKLTDELLEAGFQVLHMETLQRLPSPHVGDVERVQAELQADPDLTSKILEVTKR